jgi:hypothetical protein
MRLFQKTLEKGILIPSPLSAARFQNFVEEALRRIKESYPSQYDPVLGYVPRAGYSGTNNYWDTRVTILPDTLRSNGHSVPAGEGCILCAGDSFTFGSEVSDAETWPAHLEKITGKPVANAGVFGYGLDQIYLRARSLSESLSPSVLIFSVIPDDVTRMALSMRAGVEKPYFEIRDGRLELKNQPPSNRRPVVKMGPLAKMLGYSYCLDYLMRRTGKVAWWYSGTAKLKDVEVKVDCNAIAKKIFDEVLNLSARKNIRPFIVLQYKLEDILDKKRSCRKPFQPLIVHARERGIPILDFYPLLAALPEKELLALYCNFNRFHMNSAGNLFTARHIAAALCREGLIPPDTTLTEPQVFYERTSQQFRALH